jgi:hypothetical protein
VHRGLALLALAACEHKLVTVHPVEIAHASVALHVHDKTDLLMMRDSTDPVLHPLAMHDVVEARLDPKPWQPVKLSVADLLADCPATAFELDDETRAAYPKCALLAANGRKIVVADERHASSALPTAGVALGVGGLFFCAFECPRPYNYISSGTLIVAGAIVVGGVLYLMYELSRIH